MSMVIEYPFTLPENLCMIDAHTHLERWNDGERSNLCHYKDYLDAYREAAGFHRVNVTCVPYLRDRDVTLNMLGAFLKLDSDRYFVHAGLVYPVQPISLPFPRGFAPDEQLRDLIAVGFDGVKMLEDQPNARKLLEVPRSDMAYDPYFSLLEEEQVHVIWHVNNPHTFWSPESIALHHNPAWVYDETFPGYEQIYSEIYEVLKRHPLLKITFAHMFFISHQPDRVIDLLERFPNVCLDITPGLMIYSDFTQDWNRWREILLHYADRILLGTDFSTRNAGEHRITYELRFLMTEDEFNVGNKPVRGMNFPREMWEKLVYGNFVRRVGETPRPIDQEALREYLRKYEPLMTHPLNTDYVMQQRIERQLL